VPDFSQDPRVREILAKPRVVAVVGMSPRPDRPSHEVGVYLARHGFKVIPVYPAVEEVAGLRAYPSLDDVPRDAGIEIVDVFVSARRAGPIADQAARTGARIIWFQPGTENPEAEARARELGLEVFSRRCMMADHIRLIGDSGGKSS